MQPEKNKDKSEQMRPAFIRLTDSDKKVRVPDGEEKNDTGFSKGAVNESTTKDRKNVNGDPNIIQGNRLGEEDAQT